MTLLTVAHLAPLFTLLSRQEHCSGLLFPSPGDLPDPGTEPGAPSLQVDSLLPEPPGKPNSGCGFTSYQNRAGPTRDGVVSYFCILKSNGNLINIMD